MRVERPDKLIEIKLKKELDAANCGIMEKKTRGANDSELRVNGENERNLDTYTHTSERTP